MPDLIDTLLGRAHIVRETARAYLFSLPGTSGKIGYGADREIWLPKSAVTWIDVKPYGETAHIPAWLARKLNPKGR